MILVTKFVYISSLKRGISHLKPKAFGGFNVYHKKLSKFSDIQFRRQYKSFAHTREKLPRFLTKHLSLAIVLGMVLLLINPTWVNLKAFPSIEAAQIVVNDSKNEKMEVKDTQEAGNEDRKRKKSKKSEVRFPDRKITIQYENWIRAHSSPNKIFHYFATVKVISSDASEIYMTKLDFLRAITPGMKQPDGLGLDQYKRYDPKNLHTNLEVELDEDSIFYKLGSYGLITFSDYIFLLTVLSTSRRHFEIAFRMFDVNGDGDVDYEEFKKIAALIRQQSSIGSRHKDDEKNGNVFNAVNSALMTYFFGADLKQKLKIEKFLDFQEQLQKEILNLEFEHKNPTDDGYITEEDFTELILAYAGFSEKKKSKILKRVRETFEDSTVGIHKDEYLKFFHFLNNINDVDTALTFYHIVGASIDPATLKQVAKTVAHVDLSNHILKVVYTIFDENMDGQLSKSEFVAVMKKRALRGLEKSKETGLAKFFQSIIRCAKNRGRDINE